MVPTIEEIREKYPRARYAPDQECKRCNGSGSMKPLIQGNRSEAPCPCLFFAPQYREEVCNIIAKTAKTAREDGTVERISQNARSLANALGLK